jgi:hypothetical protein
MPRWKQGSWEAEAWPLVTHSFLSASSPLATPLLALTNLAFAVIGWRAIIRRCAGQREFAAGYLPVIHRR